MLKQIWPYLLPMLAIIAASLRSRFVPVDPAAALSWWQSGLLWIQRWLTAYAPKGTVGIANSRFSIPLLHVPAIAKPGQAPLFFLLPITFIGIVFLSACLSANYCANNPNDNHCKIEKVLKCDAPMLLKEIVKVLPVVIADLFSSNFGQIPVDVLNIVKADGMSDVNTIAQCAVQSIGTNLVAPVGAALTPESAQLQTRAQQCLHGACTWLVVK